MSDSMIMHDHRSPDILRTNVLPSQQNFLPYQDQKVNDDKNGSQLESVIICPVDVKNKDFKTEKVVKNKEKKPR